MSTVPQKLNGVHHDPRSGTIFISLRPKSQRKAVASLEYPGRVVLDLDEEGDVYGVRLLGVAPQAAVEILRRLKAAIGSGSGSGDSGQIRK